MQLSFSFRRSAIVLALCGLILNSGCIPTTIPDSEKEYKTLTVNVQTKSTSGTVSPNGGVFEKGTKMVVVATPSTGWKFKCWEGDSIGVNKKTMITMDTDKTLTAVFTPTTSYTLEVTKEGNGTVNTTSGTYDPGDVVALSATPDAGWRFSNWKDGLTGTDPNASVTMSANKKITAVFVQQMDLTLTTQGEGTVTKSPANDSNKYDKNTEVTLTATPANSDWRFNRWEGDITGTTNPYVVKMDSAKTIKAIFTSSIVHLTVNTDGQGSTSVDPAGGSYQAGTSVTLTATPAQGWHLARWSGGASGINNTLQVTMNDDKTITAEFEQDAANYPLSLTVQGQGSLTPASDTSYASGTQVSVQATPADGWVFDHWEGDQSGSTNPATITMNASRKITGVFAEKLALTTSVEGSGSITKDPSADKYAPNASVTLTATPDSGWSFTRWEGDATGTANPLTLTMSAAKTVKAVFSEITNPRVKFETLMGNFIVELDPVKAPITVANFLRYVNEGFYDGTDGLYNGGTIFHRVIPNFMIQGGGFVDTDMDETGMSDMVQKTTHDPIINESNNGLKNVRGAIAMARTTDPNSATSQFFINTVDNTSLDYVSAANPGYAVFGKVVEGMDVVDNISNVETRTVNTPTSGQHQNVPLIPVFISKVTVLNN